jgi:hypothetical protein
MQGCCVNTVPGVWKIDVGGDECVGQHAAFPVAGTGLGNPRRAIERRLGRRTKYPQADQAREPDERERGRDQEKCAGWRLAIAARCRHQQFFRGKGGIIKNIGGPGMAV